MPAFYAHYRFGREVAELLDGEILEIVKKHREQFDIGLQGPDVFFFYKPLTGGGKPASYGHQLHRAPAYHFFERGRDVIEKKGVLGKEYAYLMGVICHFILDSQCHGYIDSQVKETGVAHLEIEEEFEKELLRRDDKNPVSFPLSPLVPCDKETIETISAFYPNLSEKNVRDSLLGLRRVKRFFNAPGAVKQGLINTALRATGHYAQLKGLMNQRKDNPRCGKTNEELFRLYEEAVPLSAEMIACFDESLRTGSNLPERFYRNFL